MKQIRAIAFDFDGVLMMPWTSPEESFPQIRPLLKDLVGNNIFLATTSFNPNAFHALQQQDLSACFTAFRSGCNSKWAHEDLTQYYNETHRQNLCKVQQMLDIMANEWEALHLVPCEILLIDDEIDNIRRAETAGFQTLFVSDSFLGPDWNDIYARIPHVPKPSLQTQELMRMPSDAAQIALQKVSIATKFLSCLKDRSPVQMNALLAHLGKLTKPILTKSVNPKKEETKI